VVIWTEWASKMKLESELAFSSDRRGVESEIRVRTSLQFGQKGYGK
jgi:hypothetical protein